MSQFTGNANSVAELLGSVKNGLFTLDGSHLAVQDLDCYDKKLTSLKGCPQEVGGNFVCLYNNLISLEGCPKVVGGDFNCSNNTNLTSLEGCPQVVGSNFYCNDNKNLKSLEGCPREIGGSFYCHNNKIVSLEGCPNVVGGGIYFYNNIKLTSLKGIHKYIKSVKKITCTGIKSNILGFMKIDDLEEVEFKDNQNLSNIVNRHLGGSIFELQIELIENDMDEFAKL